VGCFLVLLAILGLSSIPTGFIPIEDQGYMALSVMLPDSATTTRTEQVIDSITKQISKMDGVANIVSIGGISILDNNASLANAGVLYVIFKNWHERGKSEDLLSMYKKLNDIAVHCVDAKILVVLPPPIQGLGLSGGFEMQLELQDGTFDYKKLQAVTDQFTKQTQSKDEFVFVGTSFRASVPQLLAPIDRTKVESLGVTMKDAMDTLQTYLGSSYVNLFSKFGQVFQVYVQAEPKARMTVEDVKHFYVKNQSQDMVPFGTFTEISQTLDPSIISLHNLYPSSNLIGLSSEKYSSGEAMIAMEKIAENILPTGISYQWTNTSYQEKVTGNSSYYIFVISLILVYFILAGQYENWVTPAAVMLSVPLALLGTVLALKVIGVANNLYTQIGILLLIALSAKNAILIVEVAREQRLVNKKSIVEAATIGAKTRFRPIMMTSFAFIMGVLPLVFATGAGAYARKSIGIAVCSGMLASTCLAVVFVPVFYVLLQTWQEKRDSLKHHELFN
jgi:HAE1 family hydrophobic/amphiphilic exporter-1